MRVSTSRIILLMRVCSAFSGASALAKVLLPFRRPGMRLAAGAVGGGDRLDAPCAADHPADQRGQLAAQLEATLEAFDYLLSGEDSTQVTYLFNTEAQAEGLQRFPGLRYNFSRLRRNLNLVGE
jgi:hypothetical protein